MKICGECKYFINNLISNNVGTCSRNNIMVSKEGVENCFEPHSLEYKTPSTPNWTLEKAREDYIKNNKECRKCKFIEFVEVKLGNGGLCKLEFKCQVKEQEINIKDAEKCKYYTFESVRNKRKDVCGLDRYLNCTLCNNNNYNGFDHIYKDERGVNILNVTANYNGYIDDFEYGLIEINYCPICGRKLD